MQEYVCLLGVTHDTYNYGVRVLLSAAAQNFALAQPKVAICVLDYGHAAETWTEWTSVGERSIELINVRFSWKLHLHNNIFRLIVLAAIAQLILPQRLRSSFLSRNPWIKKTIRAKAHMALSGGDSMSDMYGLRQFLYVALPQLLVLLLGQSLVLLPQTYGPFRSRISRCIGRYILLRAKVICSRDKEGVMLVEKLVGTGCGSIRVIPDLGFSMEPEEVSERIDRQIRTWRKAGVVIGLNVSKLLYMGGYTGGNMFGLREHFPQVIRTIVQFLIQDLKAIVLLIPHVSGEVESEESEVILCRELASEFEALYPNKVAYINEYCNHRQIKSVIGRCDVFVGARMHACIAAVSQCVPTVALAYSHKFVGVMGLISVGVEVVDLREAVAQDACIAISKVVESKERLRNELVEKIPRIQEEIRAFFRSEFILPKKS